MGHYDELRPGNCPRCGQNLNYDCEHNPVPQRPPVTVERERLLDNLDEIRKVLVAVRCSYVDALDEIRDHLSVTHPARSAEAGEIVADLKDMLVTQASRAKYYDMGKFMQHIPPCTGGGDQSCKCGKTPTWCNFDALLDECSADGVLHNANYVGTIRKAIAFIERATPSRDAQTKALIAAAERAGGCLAIHDRLGIAGKDDKEALAMLRAALAAMDPKQTTTKGE